MVVNTGRTPRTLSDFSKGKVIPKFQLVELTRPIKLMSWVVLLFEVGWFALWMSLIIRLDNWWFAVPLVLPVTFREHMYRFFIRWRQIGMITLHDDAMIFDLNGGSRKFSFKDQKMLKIWTVVTAQTRSAHLPQNSMIVGIQVDNDEQYLVLNAMHLTVDDKLQFMYPPPSFGSLMFEACAIHKIKAMTKKNERWSDWLEST